MKEALDLTNKTWICPLQKIVQKFDKLNFSKIEKIYAYVKALWISPLKISIPLSKVEKI